MSLYEQPLPYYQVDTPLNEDFEPQLLPIVRRDLPVDQVQQRMLLILASVVIIVGLLAVFVVPKRSPGAASQSVAQTGDVPAVTENVNSAEAAAPVPPGALSPVFSREVLHWQPQILAWAAQYGLDPDIVATIMQIESCGDPQAVSRSGAQGLFQVMPFHFQTGENTLDPDTNAKRGLSYYAERLQQTSGDIFQAFAGYNGGHVAAGGSWDTWANETQRYYVWTKGLYEDAKAGLPTSPTLQQWMEAGGFSLCQQAATRLGLQ
jgi:soluble lytic murein transglycosylase-like protein